MDDVTGPVRVAIGRLALRVEGDYWNAYYAIEQTTMAGSLLLGSIAMRFVADNSRRKEAFMDMMRGVVADIIRDATGIKPKFGEPETAPEHERAGRS